MRNLVCLCERHHGSWKWHHIRLYWHRIRYAVGEVRWQWLEEAKADKRPHKVEWTLVKVGLEQNLRGEVTRSGTVEGGLGRCG